MMAMESSFWGLVLKPEKRYEQIVSKSFHVSKATLEPSANALSAITSIFAEIENEEFIIANLAKNNLNESLDLNFMEGEKIIFRVSGSASVHLTGYLLPESDIDESYVLGSEADEASEEEEEIPALVNGTTNKKRKGRDSDQMLTLSKKKKMNHDEKAKDVVKAQMMQKKIQDASKKKLADSEEESDDDSDEEADTTDEGITEITHNFAEEEDSAESDDSDAEDDDDDEEEEDDDDNDEDEEEEMEVQEKSPEKNMNGKSPKHEKKAKNETLNQNKNKNVETPNNKKKNKEEKTPNIKNKNDDKTPNKPLEKTPKTPARIMKGGIKVEDLKIGNGPEAKKGRYLGMYYDGRLKSNNKRFDATLNGKPFKFRLGAGEVIKGWDLGLEGIKVGGKRKITIPPQMAYGSQGAPPDIPPNSTLVFEVECKHVN